MRSSRRPAPARPLRQSTGAIEERGLSLPASGDITVRVHAELLARSFTRSEGSDVGPSIPIHEADEDDEFAPRWPDDGSPPRRRRAGGWLVAVVMLAAIGFFSFAIERRYQFVEILAGRILHQRAGLDARPDPRLETFV